MTRLDRKQQRTRCLCLGCKRTTRYQYDEWICGKHWSAVPRHLRRRWFKYRNRVRKDPRWARIAEKCWLRCKSAAIEEALMGVSI